MEKRKRPKIVWGTTPRTETGCGHIYITINNENGKPFEVFATLGKSGGCATCQLEGLTRAISLGLQFGVPVEEYIKELKEIKCPSTAWDEGVQVLSCSDAIAKELDENRNNYTK